MCRMGSASASVGALGPEAEFGKSARCLYSVRTVDLIIVIFSDFWRLSKSISYVFSTRQTGSTPTASTISKLINLNNLVNTSNNLSNVVLPFRRCTPRIEALCMKVHSITMFVRHSANCRTKGMSSPGAAMPKRLCGTSRWQATASVS
jgi:hypothetical protein